VDYRLVLGSSPQLDGRVTVVNQDGRPWFGAQLDIDLDIVLAELDADGDGISTSSDMCPELAERFDGIDDDDGCPERGRVVWQKNETEILERVLFKPGRSTLDTAAGVVLDRVVAQMDATPSLKVVQVAGHADRVEPKLVKLSEARATAVRDALIARGAESSRLVAVGKAADVPLNYPNKPELNRRVDFGVLERTDEEETVGTAFPIDVPALAPTAVQSLLRPVAKRGGSRHVSPDVVGTTVLENETQHVTFLRTPIKVDKVLLWTPAAPDVRMGLKLVNGTEATLPRGKVSVLLDKKDLGSGDLEMLRPGEAMMVDYGVAANAPIIRDVVERVHSARIISAKNGFTVVEKQITRATTLDNRGRDLIYVFHKKGPTRIVVALPKGTLDVGDAWWIPVPPGKLVVEENELRRHRVKLLDALPKETEPYLDDPQLPPDIAKALRSAMALRNEILAAAARSPEHYAGRGKLRALLATIQFGL